MDHARVLSIVAVTTCLTASIGRTASAQATRPTTEPMPLPFAIPDGAKVQTELDGSDSDILGMLKQLIEGFTETPTKTPADPAKPVADGIKPAAAADSSNDDPDWMKYLTDGRLSAFLKDVHRMHFVSYTLAKPDDVVANYEKSYAASGGHRIFFQAGSSPMLIEGFPGGQGFAAILQDTNNVFVMRADGYPNLKIVGSVARAFVGSMTSGGGLPFGIGGSKGDDKAPEAAPAKPATPAPPAKPAPKKK